MKFFLPLFLSLAMLGCVSSGEDYQVSADVGHYLAATHVVPEDTGEADRTHRGRIVYAGPGVNGNPHFTYYEVTSPHDMALLKEAAQLALQHVPAAKSVTLHFMERQVFHTSTNGGGFRGKERELLKVVIRRGRQPNNSFKPKPLRGSA